MQHLKQDLSSVSTATRCTVLDICFDWIKKVFNIDGNGRCSTWITATGVLNLLTGAGSAQAGHNDVPVRINRISGLFSRKKRYCGKPFLRSQWFQSASVWHKTSLARDGCKSNCRASLAFYAQFICRPRIIAACRCRVLGTWFFMISLSVLSEKSKPHEFYFTCSSGGS